MADGVRLARSDIVAFIASDDLANPDYVRRITAALPENGSAIAAYVTLDRVDEKGVSLRRPVVLPLMASRLELLRGSFLGQNQLPSPGMAIRRADALEIMPPEGSSQYSDWILQNRVLMRGEIVMLPDLPIRYRVSAGSLSASSVGSMSRDALETRMMMNDFLAIREMSLIVQAFPEESRLYASLPNKHIHYVLARLAMLSPNAENVVGGMSFSLCIFRSPAWLNHCKVLSGLLTRT